MKILVLGGDGMLGHKVLQVLYERYADTLCTIRGRVDDERHRSIDLFRSVRAIEGVDSLDLASLDSLLLDLKPQVTVNCVGVIKQRDAAKEAIPSITINALLPHRLAAVCAQWGGRLVHFSTDCVFSGRRGNYTEKDVSDAEDLYGRTKFLGEVNAANALTLRTSIIGRELFHRQSLLEWSLGQRGKTLRGFTRALYSGVTTNHLAKLVATVIGQHSELSGLYQVTSKIISKCELLCLINEAYGLGQTVVPDDEFFCDRSLVGSKFERATGLVCPPWPELVAELAEDPTPYDKWRGSS